MTMQPAPSGGTVAFAIVYFTFFLDNVLLTVLVPIIPDWVRGGAALSLWARHDAPLAQLLNSSLTLHAAHEEHQPGTSGAQAVVGVVLGAKAAAQLAAAGPSAAAVCRHGPARVLRAATMMLVLAALAFWACAALQGWRAALLVALGRVAHGAGAAAANVAGLALAARALPTQRQQRALAALLGAVALGVLVGYPFGGMSDALGNRGAPFLLLAATLFADFAVQCVSLAREEFNAASARLCRGWREACGWRVARRGATGACAGAVLLTTSVMATLEPCLPLWLVEKFHPQRWAAGAVFVPDSVGYLAAASLLGGVAARVGAERVALLGCVAVGLAALLLPLAGGLGALVAPHALLGLGLGATDAALLPALLTRHRTRVAPTAALLQAAASAAYALGPALGGLASWALGFETTMRALGVLNLLYAAFLYRALSLHPLSDKWGASAGDGSDEDSSDDSGAAMPAPIVAGELAPLSAGAPHLPIRYTSQH